jgi:hypothetical protein
MTLERTERFWVDRGGCLVRSVTPRLPGKAYEHRCTPASYQHVANEVDELGDAGFTGEDLVARTGLPFTQVMVALAFMRERGCVVTEHKRHYPPPGQTGGVHADAMLEYCALREEPKEA